MHYPKGYMVPSFKLYDREANPYHILHLSELVVITSVIMRLLSIKFLLIV